MSSQTGAYRSTHPGFENNLLCKTYVKYVKYAKYAYAKYVKYVYIYAKYVIYTKYAKYVILVYNLGDGGMRFPAVWQ
jgi:hypothetical protein